MPCKVRKKFWFEVFAPRMGRIAKKTKTSTLLIFKKKYLFVLQVQNTGCPGFGNINAGRSDIIVLNLKEKQ